MKKLILKTTAAMVISSCVLCSAAYAQSIEFTKDSEKLVYTGGSGSVLVLNGYKDGKLLESRVLQSENGVYTTEDTNDEYEWRLCDMSDGQIYSIKKTEAEVTVPEEDNTQEEVWQYTPNIYPEETYDRAIDALYAFGVVESISTSVKEGGEICYKVEYVCQKQSRIEYISEDINIISASDNASYLQGASLAALERGDVIYIDREISGKAKSVSLIYRPVSNDVITSGGDYGTDFEKLFSVNGAVAGYDKWTVLGYGEEARTGKGVTQYAFGMCARRDGNTLYLLNGSGNLDEAIEIELKDGTAVYVCDLEKEEGIETESIAAVGSNISKKEFNNGGTVALNKGEYSYALVRLVDGVATDVAYYTY